MTQTWLVTGASRGIGLEYTCQLAAAGERVIATARDVRAAEALQALAADHAGVTIELLDVDDRASIAALGARLAGTPIDVLVNNAGLYGGSWDTAAARQTLDGMDFDQWEQLLRVNVLAPFHLIRVLLPNLRLGHRRLVLNMSSDLASIANNTLGGSHAYRSSKAALNMLTKGLSIDLAPEGISVVSLAPGWVRTDLGGPQAHWSVSESVTKQREVIAALTRADSGRFIDLLGRAVNW